MTNPQHRKFQNTTGTTTPIYVPGPRPSRPVRLGLDYFYINIYNAQAAFTGKFGEQAKQLVVTSQVILKQSVLGNAPINAIQQYRTVQKNQPVQLGLSPNLVDLVPATMEHVSVTLEFLLDTKNNLTSMANLINDKAFVSGISFAPGVAAVALTISGLSQKIIQTFLPSETDQRPVLRFYGDFNLPGGQLLDGYYVILGSSDEHNPLPESVEGLSVGKPTLMLGGNSIKNLSYVILEVVFVPARTRELNMGVSWNTKLTEAESVAQSSARNLFANLEEKEQEWHKCMRLFTEVEALLGDDPNYVPREKEYIVAQSYNKCRLLFAGNQRTSPFESLDVVEMPEWLDTTSDRVLLGLSPEEDLDIKVAEYETQVEEARSILGLSQSA